MTELAVIIRRSKYNRYSIAALVSAIDLNLGDEARRVSIHFAGDTSELAEKASILKKKVRKLITLYSFMTTELPSTLDTLERELKLLKRLGAIAIAGGPHASGDPVGTLNLGFDYVVVGEAEETLPSLLRAFLEGLEEASIEGVVYREGDRYCYSGRPRPIDLDKYPNFPYWRGIYAPIELTRGCNFACRFCQVSFTHGGVLRHRSLESTLELARRTLESGRRDLRFITPNAFSYLGNGREVNIDGLCSLVEGLEALTKSLGGRFFIGTFPSEVRPEHAAVEEAVRCIAGRVANKRIIIGAQSGSERVLKLMHRGHTVEDVVQAVETLNRHGFGADVDIIIGFPGEAPEDLEATIRLCEYLTSRYKARIHAHYYLPLPGTPLAGLKPVRPSQKLLRRLFRLLGRGLLYGDWLKQYKLSWEIVRLYDAGVIVGIKGFRYVKKCSKVAIRPCPYAPLAS
ncbi:MAG: TIGR04013 family B12-binding domain/radical SAM domain-containing protein [Desulfurococcales archaeon]|nr:TIGR04013 family B12-binding domain/radical SAM domain-containing protein [Desulfurococcales archaeon]